MPILFHTKCTATFGVENPGAEVHLTLAKTQSKNSFDWMSLFSSLAYCELPLPSEIKWLQAIKEDMPWNWFGFLSAIILYSFTR